MPALLIPPNISSCDGAIRLADFYYISDADQFLYTPIGALWTAKAVNGRLPSIKTGTRIQGKYVRMKPSSWLMLHRAVEQQTWMPGEPAIIEDRLVTNGGWLTKHGAHAYNLYIPPTIVPGDASKATPWIKHLELLYPEDAEDIANWFAHRVQRPGEKINHALVLGGDQGIGKDWLLEALKLAVAAWNFQEVSPTDLLSQYTPFVKAVVLRVNEAHDLGEEGRGNRYAFYERLKVYTAAPPNVLACADKYLRRYYVPNVLGVVITTNHKTDGVFLQGDDRRHLVAWSNITKEQLNSDFWNRQWHWLQHEGGAGHVAAHLAQRDLSKFDPCAVPRQTTAFFEVINASRSPEDADLADVLDGMEKDKQGKPKRPDVCSILSIAAAPGSAVLTDWVLDRKRRRSFPYRMERCGYIACRNPDDKRDGLWVINGKRQTLYVRSNMTAEQRLRAARDYVLRMRKTAGNS